MFSSSCSLQWEKKRSHPLSASAAASSLRGIRKHRDDLAADKMTRVNQNATLPSHGVRGWQARKVLAFVRAPYLASPRRGVLHVTIPCRQSWRHAPSASGSPSRRRPAEPDGLASPVATRAAAG